MNPLTNADYYAEPDIRPIRTEQPEPFAMGEMERIRQSVARGYRRFCRAHFLQTGPYLFGRKTK